MELKRKLFNELLRWKNSSGNKRPLLLVGGYRTGKSYLAEQFAACEYESSLRIRLSALPPKLRSLLASKEPDPSRILQLLQHYAKVRLIPGRSLILFDGLEECPEARQLLTRLSAMRRYDCMGISSGYDCRTEYEKPYGSLSEKVLMMHPLDFEEFLWALGDESSYPLIREHFQLGKPLERMTHFRIMDAFRQYLMTGGMPEAIAGYGADKDLAEADLQKRELLRLYRAKIKTFPNNRAEKALAVFSHIPVFLGGKEKKFRLSVLGSSARMREYEKAFRNLIRSFIANPCYNAAEPETGSLTPIKNKTGKLYLSDTGLLLSLAGGDEDFLDNALYRDILLDRLNTGNGMLLENIVSQMLTASGHPLLFYSRSDSMGHANRMEIDFLIRREGKLSPLEVKSTALRQGTSLHKFISRFGKQPLEPFVLWLGNLGEKDGIRCLPVYMAGLL